MNLSISVWFFFFKKAYTENNLLSKPMKKNLIFAPWSFLIIWRWKKEENQDGSVGRHTAPPPQPELTENWTARKSDTKKIKNKHSSRPVGGAETGSRGREDSRGRGRTETGRVWDEWVRQSDHWQTLRPHIRADRLRGPDSEWRRAGQAEQWVVPRGPTFEHR